MVNILILFRSDSVHSDKLPKKCRNWGVKNLFFKFIGFSNIYELYNVSGRAQKQADPRCFFSMCSALPLMHLCEVSLYQQFSHCVYIRSVLIENKIVLKLLLTDVIVQSAWWYTIIVWPQRGHARLLGDDCTVPVHFL